MKVLLPILVLIAVVADARTWTSRDGRTLEGDGVAWNTEGVHIKRARATKILVLRYEQLSEKDGEWAIENLPYFTNDDVRLRAKTLAITTKRRERDTGKRIVTISDFRYSGGRITGGNVNVTRIMEKYKKSGRGVEVYLSSIRGPGIVGLEFYGVKGQGPDKEMFHSQAAMVEFEGGGSYAHFQSPAVENFNGWVVIARSATSGKIIGIQSSARPLEDFILQQIPREAEVVQNVQGYKKIALDKIRAN